MRRKNPEDKWFLGQMKKYAKECNTVSVACKDISALMATAAMELNRGNNVAAMNILGPVLESLQEMPGVVSQIMEVIEEPTE